VARGSGRLPGHGVSLQGSAGGRETDDAEHVLGAGSPRPLLGAAHEQRCQPQASTHHERTDSGRAAKLVGTHRHGVDAEVVEGDRNMAHGGGSVAVNRHAGLAAQRHDLRQGLQDADLVVGQLAVHERRAVARQELCEDVKTQTARRSNRDLDEPAGPLAGLAHAGMLDAGAEQGTARSHRRCSEHGGVGGFCRTAREHDACGPCAEKGGNGLPGRFHGHARSPALLVHAAGITDTVGSARVLQPPLHCPTGFRPYGRRRSVVEVVPARHLSRRR
jgi:hypothetical protein